MKKVAGALYGIAFLGLLSSCKKNRVSNIPTTATDSFIVTVNNGYGDGKYKIGDTVHLFSNAYSDNQLFGKWSGDTALLNSADEWHTWLIMPNKNVNVTGSLENISNFTLQYEQITGRDRKKPVYYYFPHDQKGFVYLLHGTSGSAANLVGDYEWQQLIKDLVNDHFGVIVTEAEEATTGVDANGDAHIRWYLLPYDTTANVDYANIRIITDTFYNRRIIDRSMPRYSIGMSDGGFFSTAISSIYGFKAGVQYCAQGSSSIIKSTGVPIQFCMERFDSNPSVGQAGNAEALNNSISLNARGICSRYLVNEKSPIYPQRFARSGDITENLSISLFNELKSKGYINNKNYYVGYSDSLTSALQSNPANFPVINSLTPKQKLTMLEQINISISDHHIYSDYNRATLKFLKTQCQ